MRAASGTPTARRAHPCSPIPSFASPASPSRSRRPRCCSSCRKAVSSSTTAPSHFVGLQAHVEKRRPRRSTSAQAITVLELLHHTGGFDRDKSFDPMFRSIDIAEIGGGEAAGEARGDHPLHDGPASRFRPGHPRCLLEFRLLRARPRHRESLGRALREVRPRARARAAAHQGHAHRALAPCAAFPE